MRLQGITTLTPWTVVALFTAVVSGFAGFSILALGITFNYLVSLFYKQPISQGLFGRSNFLAHLDRHFWWMGGGALLVGLVLGVVTLILGSQGWDITRLWFYLLGSAMLILTGLQLVIYWVQARVLEELSQRDSLIDEELQSPKI